jgi:hypothetical protein
MVTSFFTGRAKLRSRTLLWAASCAEAEGHAQSNANRLTQGKAEGNIVEHDPERNAHYEAQAQPQSEAPRLTLLFSDWRMTFGCHDGLPFCSER